MILYTDYIFIVILDQLAKGLLPDVSFKSA